MLKLISRHGIHVDYFLISDNFSWFLVILRRFVDLYKCITILSTSLDALLWKFTSHIRQLSPWAPFSERLSDFVSAFSHAEFQFCSAWALFSHVHILVATDQPTPFQYPLLLLFCCLLTCDANANVAAAAFVAHILCDCHWVRGWDLNESASVPCFSCCFSFFFWCSLKCDNVATSARKRSDREHGNGGEWRRGRQAKCQQSSKFLIHSIACPTAA